eukprot:UN23533
MWLDRLRLIDYTFIGKSIVSVIHSFSGKINVANSVNNPLKVNASIN